MSHSDEKDFQDILGRILESLKDLSPTPPLALLHCRGLGVVTYPSGAAFLRRIERSLNVPTPHK